MSSRLIRTETFGGTGTVVSEDIDLTQYSNQTIGFNFASNLGSGTPSILCGDGTIMESLKIVNPADGSWSTVAFPAINNLLLDLPCDKIRLQILTATNAAVQVDYFMTARK